MSAARHIHPARMQHGLPPACRMPVHSRYRAPDATIRAHCADDEKEPCARARSPGGAHPPPRQPATTAPRSRRACDRPAMGMSPAYKNRAPKCGCFHRFVRLVATQRTAPRRATTYSTSHPDARLVTVRGEPVEPHRAGVPALGRVHGGRCRAIRAGRAPPPAPPISNLFPCHLLQPMLPDHLRRRRRRQVFHPGRRRLAGFRLRMDRG